MEPKCYICSVSRLSGILTNCPHATYPPPHRPGNKSVQGRGAEGWGITLSWPNKNWMTLGEFLGSI